MNFNFRNLRSHDEHVRKLTREFLQEHRAHVKGQCMPVIDQTARYAEWKYTAIYRFLCALYPEELTRIEKEDGATHAENKHA